MRATARELAQRLLKQEFLDPEDLEALTLSRIGRYDVLSPLGEGAAGQVFLARDALMKRQVAIKLLRYGPQVSLVPQEVQTLAQLDHPGVVSIHDAGVHEGRPFFVMAHAGDTTLADAEELSLREWVEVLVRVLEACDYVHSKGIVHLDLKPAHIILGARPAIADFGIARLLEPSTSPSGPPVGTPAYMAPEQFHQGDLGPWTDIYAAGAMLYECLSGRVPMRELRLAAELNAAPSAPGELTRVALRASDESPENRYESAETMARDLRSWLGHGDRSSSPAPWALAAVLSLVLGSVWAGAGSQPAPPAIPSPLPPAASPALPPTQRVTHVEPPSRAELAAALAGMASPLPASPTRLEARDFARACWKILFRALDEEWEPPGELPGLVALTQRPAPATPASSLVGSNAWLLRWWFERDANGRTRPKHFVQAGKCFGPAKGKAWEAEATTALSFLLAHCVPSAGVLEMRFLVAPNWARVDPSVPEAHHEIPNPAGAPTLASASPAA